MAYVVRFAPEAEAQILALRRFIAGQAGLTVAQRFTDAIVDHCAGPQIYPLRGVPREDLRPGLRTISFRGRVTVAYSVADDSVTILAIAYAGQDLETLLGEE